MPAVHRVLNPDTLWTLPEHLQSHLKYLTESGLGVCDFGFTTFRNGAFQNKFESMKIFLSTIPVVVTSSLGLCGQLMQSPSAECVFSIPVTFVFTPFSLSHHMNLPSPETAPTMKPLLYALIPLP